MKKIMAIWGGLLAMALSACGLGSSLTLSYEHLQTPSLSPTSRSTATATADASIRVPLSCGESHLAADPAVWAPGAANPDAPNILLEHKSIAGCALRGWGGSGLDPHAPQWMKFLGQHNWWLIDYGPRLVYVFMDRSEANQCEILFMIPSEDVAAEQWPTCQADAETAIATLQGFTPATPLPTFTPRPEFSCPKAPESYEYLPGEGFNVVRSVYLRSEPKRDKNNAIRLLQIGEHGEITGNPVCGPFTGGAYVYWPVRMDNGQEGWVAEADPNGKYIVTEGFAG